MGAMVNNSNAQGSLQAFLELHKENNPIEQNSHSHWNPDRGSRNKIPRRWQSAGDYGADGDEYGGGFGGVVSGEES